MQKYCWVIVLFLLVSCSNDAKVQPVTNYKPKQPIDFPHDIHTGKGGIDCKYCHNSVNKSKKTGLPTVYLCTNCHKTIKGRSAKWWLL